MKFSFNTQIDFSVWTFNIFFRLYVLRVSIPISVVIHTDNVVEIIYLRHFGLIAWKKNLSSRTKDDRVKVENEFLSIFYGTA